MRGAACFMSYKRVQNGSDVRGVALGKQEAVTLTPKMVRNIAKAFTLRLQRGGKGNKASNVSVGIGRDSRVTGEELCEEAMKGIVDAGPGCKAYDLGLATTPAMFMSTITPGFEYSGSIMLTASHLPYDRNGMKFFTPEGGLGKADIAEILEMAEGIDGSVDEASGGGGHKSAASFMPTYAGFLRDQIVSGVGAGEMPLKGLKIVVDAGNGAGGFFARDVLEPLGADIAGSQFLEPDGMFPNHVPNPENEEAMRSIQEAVASTGADLGVIFDTDVDRSAIVDSKGVAFNKNRLIAAMAAISLRDKPGATVVTDSVTSDALTAFIESRGGKHLRFKRGYKNVIEKGKQIENCPLMIETSGHGAMAENHYLDDGAYMAVKMIIEAARRNGDLAGLVEGFEEPLEATEMRVKYSESAPDGYGTLVVEGFQKFCEGDSAPEGWASADSNFEGWRVSVLNGEGWVLIRQSLHDPLIVINAESNMEGGVEQTMAIVTEFLKDYEFLTL
ncbi:phosphoglucomutase [Chloropicon primus]|uniref:phosphoglucomutase (alpha-D-glucose-1,6-bisphosphate-dependent) n=2 Tax=Chloropicon primus TaxID=1764295 RepID=A0A5B8MSF6_9CHLO|nr:phosphoglucomutase [Chloropicon primus]UPR01488.1 phosphoglucomutase [Chloropicon primus]|eukprot:QDZ22272.1 phosphoglucomutase [Chloropicon primus]